MLTKEDKEEIFRGVMEEMSNMVLDALDGKMLTEADESKSDKKNGSADDDNYKDSVFVKDFCGNKEIHLCARKLQHRDTDYYVVHLFQDAGDNEFDAYAFRYVPYSNKLRLVRLSDNGVNKPDELSKILEDNGIKDAEVRDVYVEQSDIKSIFEVVDKDAEKVFNAVVAALKEKKSDKKDNDAKKDADKKDDDNKPSEDKKQKAKHITSLLEKIAKDEDAFAEVVKLFATIETLAEKKQSFDEALKAINSRIVLKK